MLVLINSVIKLLGVIFHPLIFTGVNVTDNGKSLITSDGKIYSQERGVWMARNGSIGIIDIALYGESAAEATGRPEATGYMKSKRCTLILLHFIRNYLLANISSYLSIILLRSSRHKGTNIPKPSPEFVLNSSSDNTRYSH